ncbi:UPF0122 protein [Collibacillus ludicampi]|uniref:UPF0122 protein DNHGIG_31070 n=1 Tax=Collibacillus ludicampi TaxID=2771369 RepID=A0AAV4LIG5_9BACL|nr:putative DNA-binding protein [Collibacillus ludicampi]GIM47558.1 UPF0122 protein [Collibacillus ludicampi]
MLEKTTQMNLLYDFYGVLLTDKQRTMIEMYYLEDWSLAEISEHFAITRQAVHDNIRRAGMQLIEYEEKLHLLERYEKRRQIGQHIRELLSSASLDEKLREELTVAIESLLNES